MSRCQYRLVRLNLLLLICVRPFHEPATNQAPHMQHAGAARVRTQMGSSTGPLLPRMGKCTFDIAGVTDGLRDSVVRIAQPGFELARAGVCNLLEVRIRQAPRSRPVGPLNGLQRGFCMCSNSVAIYYRL